MHPLHVLADGFETFEVMSNDVMAGALATRSWTGATPLVVAASLAVVMALVSLVRGVRAFSFGLTWWGKHGQLRLRVESFATLAEAGGSSAAGTCMVTAGGISGIFCAELVEREAAEDGAGLLDEDEGRGLAAPEDGNLQLSLVKKSLVMGTEMGFYFFQKSHTSVASLSSLQCDGECCAASSQLAAKCEWSPVPSSLSSGLYPGEEELGEWEDVVVEEEVEEDSGARRPEIGRTEVSSLLPRQGTDSKVCTFTMPDWACSLLEPLQIAAFARRSVAPLNRKSVKLKKMVEPDFSLLRLQLTAEVLSSGGHRRRRRHSGILAGKSRSPSHVVQGEKLMATTRDDTVRIWECRHPVETLYLPRGDSVSSIDVNWDAGIAAVGTAAGLLSLWDLERALSAGTAAAHCGQVEALQIVPTSSGLSVTGGPAQVGKADSSISVWDSRMFAEGMSTRSVMAAGRNSIINGLKAQGHQIFVRDGQGCISGLDLRKLVSIPFDTMSAELAKSARLEKLSSSHSGNKDSRGEDSLCCPATGESAKEGKPMRSEESRWWDKEIGYRSEEDDEEDGWPNGILCSYPSESSGKPSWIGRLIGEIKSQLHLGGQA